MSEDSEAALAAFIRAFPLPEEIRPRLIGSPIRGNTYAVNYRVKSTGKILEKVRRKREDGNIGYTVKRVSDIVGFRFVTLFSSEVVGVVGQLLDMICHKPEMGTSPFVKDKVMEILIFDNRPDNDPLSIVSGVKSVALERGFHDGLMNKWGEKIVQVKRSNSGYSSVHVICYREAPQVAGVDEEADDDMPVEIQIRTIFEDAWGEIDHKLKYKPSGAAPKWGDGDAWRIHLNALKTLSDGCVQYSEIIRRQAVVAHRTRELVAASYASIDTPAESLKRFESFPQKVKTALKHAFELRDQALGVLLDGEKRRLLLEAIDAFDAALKVLELTPTATPTEFEVASATVRVERALCLLNTGIPDRLREASKIYEGLLETPTLGLRAVCLLRTAEAAIELGNYSEAVNNLIAAELVIHEIEEFRNHWLRATVPKLLGYAQWRQASVGPVTTRLALLEAACESTCRSLVVAEELRDERSRAAALNNLCWYEREVLEQFGPGAVDASHLRKHVEALEQVLAADAPQPQARKPNRLHSLLLARRYLGDMPAARGYARELLVLFGIEITTGGAALAAEIDSRKASYSVDERELLEDSRRIFLEGITNQ